MISFKSKLFKIGSWTILKLPNEASAKLPSRGQVMVKGTINGVQLQTALEPTGDGSHWLGIDEGMLQSMHANAGDTVVAEIESTKDWPEPAVPSDIAAMIDTDPGLKTHWKGITPMARWEWIRWINSTGQLETRKKRIEVAASKMRAGERRPCCFNRSMCCVPEVSKSGVLREPGDAADTN